MKQVCVPVTAVRPYAASGRRTVRHCCLAGRTDAEPAAVPFQQSVITAEIERWPETALTRELARHPAFVNRDVFPIIADRLTQKQLSMFLHLPTAPWQLLADRSEWPRCLIV